MPGLILPAKPCPRPARPRPGPVKTARPRKPTKPPKVSHFAFTLSSTTCKATRGFSYTPMSPPAKPSKCGQSCPLSHRHIPRGRPPDLLRGHCWTLGRPPEHLNYGPLCPRPPGRPPERLKNCLLSFSVFHRLLCCTIS